MGRILQRINFNYTNDAVESIGEDGYYVPNTSTFSEIAHGIQKFVEANETTKSVATVGPKLGQGNVQSEVYRNGVRESSGSGTWLGFFSGSGDFYQENNSAAILHCSQFSGSFSGSLFTRYTNTPDFNRIIIGYPKKEDFGFEWGRSGSIPGVGTDSAGRNFYAKPFSGSFVVKSHDINKGFGTEETGSAEQILGDSDLSADARPAGTYTAKWISGSFNLKYNQYSTDPASMSADLGDTFFTSSTFTQADLNMISESRFSGTICCLTGGFDGGSNTGTATTAFSSTEGGRLQYHNYDAPDGQINMALEVAYFVGPGFNLVGDFTNARPSNASPYPGFYNNPYATSVLSSIVGGLMFTIGSQGNMISGSIESIPYAPERGVTESKTLARGGKYVLRGGNRVAVKSPESFKKIVSFQGAATPDELRIARAEVADSFRTKSGIVGSSGYLTKIRKDGTL
tara:strand:- start:2885 stop:4252 length:1368 start_codon:yes stop_codon:yes gene_type:complete